MEVTTNHSSGNFVPAEPPPQAPKKSIFANLDRLRLSMAMPEGAKEVHVRLPVRKPQRQEFFRVHPNPDMALTTAVFEEKETREIYCVAPEMMDTFSMLGDLTPVTLMLAKTRQGALLMVPFKLPTDTAVTSGWFDTALHAAERAKTKWVRMASDMALGGYRVYEAESTLDDPEWPDQPLNELLELAFKNKVIDSPDHPVFNKLLGRI